MTPANQLCECLYGLILAWALNETACTPCCHALLPSHWRHLTYATPSHTLSASHRDSSLLCLTARSPLLLLLTLPYKSRECNESVEAFSYLDQSQSTALPAATHARMEEQGRSDLDWCARGSKTCYDSQVATAWKLKVGAHNREASRGVKLMFDGAFTAGEVSFT